MIKTQNIEGFMTTNTNYSNFSGGVQGPDPDAKKTGKTDQNKSSTYRGRQVKPKLDQVPSNVKENIKPSASKPPLHPNTKKMFVKSKPKEVSEDIPSPHAGKKKVNTVLQKNADAMHAKLKGHALEIANSQAFKEACSEIKLHEIATEINEIVEESKLPPLEENQFDALVGYAKLLISQRDWNS